MLLSVTSLFACTPVPMLFMPLFGPTGFLLIMIQTLWVLLAVVLLKCFVFACLSKGKSLAAFCHMFVANIVSSIPGLIMGIAATFDLSPFGLIVGLIVVAVMLYYFKSYHSLAKQYTNKFPRPTTLCLMLCLALVLHIVLFVVAQMFINSNVTLYWIFKIAALVFPLCVGLTITTVIETLMVHKFMELGANSEKEKALLIAVVRANYITMLVVCSIGAVMLLPLRFGRDGFLVDKLF